MSRLPQRHRLCIAIAVVVVLYLFAVVRNGLLAQQRQQAKPPSFEVAEASITQLQDAMRDGKVTSKALVEAYRARIRAYDGQGPKLNAIIAINPNALRDAEALGHERG